MAGLASYFNPETSNACDACGATTWNTAIDCDDCEGPVCDCCGFYDYEPLLCRRCFARREHERRECRIPAARIDRPQTGIDLTEAS